MQKRATALAAVALAAAMGAGASSASAAPHTWLPNFTLYCDTGTASPEETVVIPVADSLWVTSGALAGHYVILDESHYVYNGHFEGRPSSEDYNRLNPAGPPRTFGVKAGPDARALSCDFVSYWADSDTSIIGPMTIAKVPG